MRRFYLPSWFALVHFVFHDCSYPISDCTQILVYNKEKLLKRGNTYGTDKSWYQRNR